MTPEKIEWLWQKVSSFPQAWDDYQAGSRDFLATMLGDKRSVIFEFREDERPVGLLSLTSVIPGHLGNLHIVFWDHSFKGREGAVQQLITRLMSAFRLHRVGSFIPEPNRPAWKFAKRIGMRHEGTLRRASKYQGKFVNLLAFGLTRQEVGNGEFV